MTIVFSLLELKIQLKIQSGKLLFVTLGNQRKNTHARRGGNTKAKHSRGISISIQIQKFTYASKLGEVRSKGRQTCLKAEMSRAKSMLRLQTLLAH